MNINDINLEVLKWNLEEMASLEEQRQLWLARRKGEMSTFEEACCGIFDDSGLSRAMDKGLVEDYYGNEVAQKVEILNHLIDKVPDNLNPNDLIEHPIMCQIRQAAKEVLESTMLKGEGTHNESS